MRIAIEIDELAFLHPKSREEVEREVLEAAKIYWLARSEIEPTGAKGVARPAGKDLVDVLLSAPSVGEDSDFARVSDVGRPVLEGDT